MIDTTVTLIGPETRTQDSTGVWRTTAATETTVFAGVNSVSRSEFFAGGQQGMKPEYVFTVFHAEYSGQKSLIYGGVKYSIYRTYHAQGSDYMELYCQRDIGVHQSEVTGNDP